MTRLAYEWPNGAYVIVTTDDPDRPHDDADLAVLTAQYGPVPVVRVLPATAGQEDA